jgi:DNA-binding XRE family transcriptional regulator
MPCYHQGCGPDKWKNVMATNPSGESAGPKENPIAAHEVEGLRQLRQLAGKGQADIASALNIKQPSVSKIEKQTDMYLSTLRSYVEAVGGETGIDYQAAAAARAAYPYSR